MGRKPRVEIAPNGDASIRTVVPRPLWLLCEAIARRWQIEPDKVLLMILDRVGGQLADPQRGAHFASTALGPEYVEEYQRLWRENFGVIASGPAIDISRLHTDPKLKSGYVGVYPNGKGFRATGRNHNGSMRHLGTFDTAEAASWARLMYYEKNDLPYGRWEVEIDRLRASGERGSDAELIKIYEDLNRTCNQEHLNELPGRPKNPSTVTYNFAGSVPAADIDEGGIEDELAEMRAKNEADQRARQVPRTVD